MDFANKKIAVLGFGIEGQDVCQYLLKKKAKITVFDQKIVSQKQGIEFKVGEDYLKNFSVKGRPASGWDIIFRSPAFKLSTPEIVEAKKAGVVVSSATKLFFELCPGKIIGVTGTKGKGTTATLVARILKQAGKKVFLAGNIGTPMLGLLPKLTKASWVVLELSSFQLQDLQKSPHLSVVLFIVPEHLDYHQNVAEYVQAKSNIVQHQKANDWAVLNADNRLAKSFCALTKAEVRFFSRQGKTNGAYVKNNQIFLKGKLIGKTKGLKLKGEHNWDNVCAAVTASALAGADLASIKKVIFSFKGLPHRLESVGKVKEIEFYNDSFSTTPETAIAAIKAFKKPIVLIAGGSEKGADFTKLGQEIAKSSVKTLVLIGQMAARIKKAALKANFRGEIILSSGGMKKIVKMAFEKAQAGDVVLLSPACASFDMFANYKERGNQFKKHARSL